MAKAEEENGHINNAPKHVLKCEKKAHEGDVRAIARTSDGGFLTASRDHLVKQWKVTEDSYEPVKEYVGATNFVTSCIVIPPSPNWNHAQIVTGSNDNIIRYYYPDGFEPIHEAKGHSANVCALSHGFGFVVSGSWDKTARVWYNHHCVAVLEGHAEAVWAVEVHPLQQIILTASADHTIKRWTNGVCDGEFIGHTDCVRDIAVLRSLLIASCSNDGTVRLWSIKTVLLHTIYAHQDYVYSIAVLNNGIDFATGGEDGVLKFWSNLQCTQSISLKDKSLWDVASLCNGDVVVGTSSGTVCIIGVGDNITEPGSYAFEGNLRNACGRYRYRWDIGSNRWLSIDDHFISEFEEPKPEEKLYYATLNISGRKFDISMDKDEYPFVAAMKFVAQHKFPPQATTQVHKFIIDKTPIKLPFPINEHFPVLAYQSFPLANSDGMKKFLIDFNENKVPKAVSLPTAAMAKLLEALDSLDCLTPEQLQSLDAIVGWQDEFLFVSLDLLRVLILRKNVTDKIANDSFLEHLLRILRTSRSHLNKRLILKIFSNLFKTPCGKRLMETNNNSILKHLENASLSSTEENVHSAAATLYLNYSIAMLVGLHIPYRTFCKDIMSVVKLVVESDALYRFVLALGTLCAGNQSAYLHLYSYGNVCETLRGMSSILKGETQKEALRCLLSCFERDNNHT